MQRLINSIAAEITKQQNIIAGEIILSGCIPWAHIEKIYIF